MRRFEPAFDSLTLVAFNSNITMVKVISVIFSLRSRTFSNLWIQKKFPIQLIL